MKEDAHTDGDASSVDASTSHGGKTQGVKEAAPKVLVGSYKAGAGGVVGESSAGGNDIPEPTTNWPVFGASAVGIIALTLWAFFAREKAATALGAVTEWISTNLGWFYILTATVVIVFVIGVAVTRTGSIRLGPDHSRPQFKLFSWSAMLFAAGIGVDLMFFSVAEPVAQYYGPPVGQGETREAAEQAVVWALFHYGMTGWALYCLMGMAFGYYAYRLNMPLAIRSALYPLIGKRIHGAVGNCVDIAAMLGTIFGIAASLGIGVVQLNYGMKVLFGVEEGPTWQIILVVVSVAVATLSAVSGVDKGIKVLSEINVLLAIALMIYVVIAGKTAFLLDGLVMNIGDYVSSLPGMTMDTYAFSDDPEHTKAWLGAWTLFFWAWWVAWAPFVGLFLARISRGRTLRQFVFGTLSIPFLFIVLWMSFFGNSALAIVRGGNDAFGHEAAANPQRGFYDLLATYPGAIFLVGLATMIGLLLYITSADSGALVMSNFTSTTHHSSQDGPVWSRIFWAVVVGALTIVMLQLDGIATVQSATVVMGLPFTIVIYLVMAGLVRCFRLEQTQKDARVVSVHAAMSGRSTIGEQQGHSISWRRRLSRANTWPSAAKAQAYITNVATPALTQVAEELCRKGINARLVTTKTQAVEGLDLIVEMGSEQNFRYQLFPVCNPVPQFTRKANASEKETYYRLEVCDLTGSLGYDIYGYTQEQLIDNVLDLYERHLEFLHMHSDLPGSSDLSDGATPPLFS
ncbi:high-affinity choline transporter BetT [Corynebacterium diphtheriae]|uniref:choline BCCT transporter BetT n=1 Tax=Corynebacterium diphtheriae TaxID=1717 RepID=UPI000245B4EC|nr:choline BCCT transporter BetT [Corynebacterium diphtheriae]MBG9246757.1 choline BCCT transporter BetT [Corynebacterium diphtheriae bv. mitis]MBG9344990.1 choline BCCT transporter BetT [Corynebacterium diphtheriae bv. gravis]AEX42887.1 high-affinity choline transport protein [Corynebacterium diphtheriae 31A]APM36272.1 high-affinity choline transporter BetT [Corynebacterium diphtheriae]EIK55342.1 high-affinity choline transport protein [Corynebacterium diphtheriae bv. intermedius str. NCTC 50